MLDIILKVLALAALLAFLAILAYRVPAPSLVVVLVAAAAMAVYDLLVRPHLGRNVR